MDDQYLILICVFGGISMLAYLGYTMFGGSSGNKLRDRLSGKSSADGTKPVKEKVGVMPMLTKVSQIAATPFMPDSREAISDLRRRLGYAGIYHASAVKMVTGAKVIGLGLGLIGGYIASTQVDGFFMAMSSLSIGGLIGYLGPMIWLNVKIKSNRQALNYGLADSLDLMVVCVEAGLTIDSAMQRVGQEMSLAHPCIAREFGITTMESRVGLSRTESLKNLATRTNCEAVQSLTAMLIQADRFGTSIASALRVHADTLRVSRHHAAEELAAKATVKMSFPLVLFIFPATFIVLAGPTAIGLMNSPLFN